MMSEQRGADLDAGIRKRLDLPKEVQNKVEAVLNYDYSFLTNEFNDNQIRAGRPYAVERVYPIMHRFGRADFEIARMLEEEFKKFVILTLMKPGMAHAPPGAVDMYWHFFVLHTEQYLSYSETIWGNFQGDPKYRHHYPAKDQTRPGQFKAYVATRELYVEVYGEPPVFSRPGARPVEVWNNPFGAEGGAGHMTSGDSYSGIIEPEEVSA